MLEIQFSIQTPNYMDRSQTYINMCTLALEVQQDWVPVHGDFFVGREGRVEVWVDKMQSQRNVLGNVDLCFSDGMPSATRYIWLAFIMHKDWGKVWKDSNWQSLLQI